MCKQLIQLIFYEFYIFDGNNDRFSAVVTLQKLGNKDMESFCVYQKKYSHCTNEDTETIFNNRSMIVRPSVCITNIAFSK